MKLLLRFLWAGTNVALVGILVSVLCGATPASAATPYRVLGNRCWVVGQHAQTRHHTPLVCVKSSRHRFYWHRYIVKSTVPSAPSTVVGPTYHTFMDTSGSGDYTSAPMTAPGNFPVLIHYKNQCASGASAGTLIHIGGRVVGLGNGPTHGDTSIYYYGWEDAGHGIRIVSAPDCQWSVAATGTY